MTAILGVDPGADGGAVLLDPTGRRAVVAWSWRQRKRRGAVVYVLEVVEGGASAAAPTPRDTVHGVARTLQRAAKAQPYALSLEGLFVPRPPNGLVCRRGEKRTEAFLGRSRHVITLAETTGQLLGPLASHAEAVWRPTAAVWRTDILGLPRNISSDAAERVAVAAMEGLIPMVADLGELSCDPHVAEAAAIARWGWVQQQQLERARRAGR